MKSFYVVRNEYLDKNKEIIQGDCRYEGCDYAAAISAYCAYEDSYVVDKQKKQYSQDIYYDLIYMLRFDVSELALEEFDPFEFDDYLRELEEAGKAIVILSNCNGDYYV